MQELRPQKNPRRTITRIILRGYLRNQESRTSKRELRSRGRELLRIDSYEVIHESPKASLQRLFKEITIPKEVMSLRMTS